jgi:dephospho-CoA kinase
MQQQTAPYAIKEAALIFESGAEKWLDKVIGIYAPVELRIQRVMQRDGIAAAEVTARLNKQMEEEEKMRLCDYIINNDEQELLIPQVLKLDEILKEEAQSKKLKA